MSTASADDRVTNARKVINTTKRKVTQTSADQSINRSTRARNVLKAKADAFDQVSAVLAGKG